MAGVIRRETLQTRAAFSFADLEQQAQRVLAQAQSEAAQLHAQAIATAQRDGEQIRAKAYEDGLAAGRDAALDTVRQEISATVLQETRERFAQVEAMLIDGLRAFEQDKRRLLAEAEAGLITLALAVAERVCKHPVAASSETALANVRAVLTHVADDADPVLHVSPQDHASLAEALPKLVAELDGLSHVAVEADDAVSPGGCVLHTRHGQVDATLEMQLRRVAEALLGVTAADRAERNDG